MAGHSPSWQASDALHHLQAGLVRVRDQYDIVEAWLAASIGEAIEE
jgi:hypothetical protein